MTRTPVPVPLQRLLFALAAVFSSIAPLGGNLGALEGAAGARRVFALRGGGRIEGKVVKRTERAVFVDVGYTILEVPLADVLEESAVQSGPADQSRGEETAETDIFFTAQLEPGTVKEKAREVAESVVHVICLEKSGSGFIINDKEGYVVTNFHVVEGEQNISVVVYVRENEGLRKEKLDKVRIIALSPFFDLALLKLEDTRGLKLRKAYLGDYERVKVGDPVFAIGNPLGLERTVSEGIVSSRNRELFGILSIQTTAPINPGNSGGPLFNIRGEVIGVTSAGYLGANNLGFAIPVHYVKDFLRNREAFAFDKDNPNTGYRYVIPPRKGRAPPPAAEAGSRPF